MNNGCTVCVTPKPMLFPELSGFGGLGNMNTIYRNSKKLNYASQTNKDYLTP